MSGQSGDRIVSLRKRAGAPERVSAKAWLTGGASAIAGAVVSRAGGMALPLALLLGLGCLLLVVVVFFLMCGRRVQFQIHHVHEGPDGTTSDDHLYSLGLADKDIRPSERSEAHRTESLGG